MTQVNQICVAIRSSGFPKSLSYEVINLIQMWLRYSGPEWTVNRLKSLKSWYVQSLSGNRVERPAWVHFTHGTPGGPLRSIFRCKKPQKVLSALMAYSGITLKKVSRTQWDKFYRSVDKDPIRKDPSTLTEGYALLWKKICPKSRISELGWSDILDGTHPSRFSHVKIHNISNRNIRIPSYDDNCGRSVEMSAEEVVKGINHPFCAWYLTNNMKFLPDHIVNFLVSRDIEQLDGDQEKNFVGRIGFIQEPGCKLRAVANPLPIFQILLSRLGKNLYSLLAKIPNDCTFDQEKGLNLVSDQLDRGNRLHSLDLSDATNNFPLGLTIAMLAPRVTYQGSSGDWMLFSALSRAEWAPPPNPDGVKKVEWTVGQPLGLYPSFAAFSLSHHCLVRDLIDKEHLSGDDAFYVILGDDIVCSDRLGPLLREAYQALDIPVSESKSVTSANIAEFAGRLVFKPRDANTQILVQPKYKTISDRSFLQLRRNLGRQVTQFFRPRQMKVVSFFELILQDHHPYGLKSWRTLKNSTEFLLSEALASAVLSEPLVQRRSPLSEDLKDLADYIHLENNRKAPVAWQQIPLSNQSKAGSSEELLLDRMGVSHADFPKEAPSSWFEDQDIGGDPRGESTLRVMEEKIEHVDIWEECDKAHARAQELMREILGQSSQLTDVENNQHDEGPDAEADDFHHHRA